MDLNKAKTKSPTKTIRFTVVSIFVLAAVLTGTVALSLQFYFSQNIAKENSAKLFNAKAKAVSEHLINIDEKADDILRIVSQYSNIDRASAFEEGINSTFSAILNENNSFYAIYLGFENGNFYELINLNASPTIRHEIKASHLDRWVVVSVHGTGDARVREFYYLDEKLNTRASRSEQSSYDASKRPWYINADKASVFKSSPYLFQHLQAPGQTYSIQLQQSKTVLALDIALSTYSEYLVEQGKNEQGEVDRELFLYQSSGDLISSNESALVKRDSQAIQPIILSDKQQAFIKSLPTLKVSNELDWAPIDFSQSGMPQGYNIDLFNLVAQMTGLEFEFVNGFTWQELVQSYKNGDIDLLQPLFKTQENEALGKFSSTLLSLPYAIITHQSEKQRIDLSTLAGKSLAIPKGWSIIPVIKRKFPEINIVELASTRAVLDAVSKQEVYAGLDNEVILKHTQFHFFISDIKYHSVENLGGELTSLHVVAPEQYAEVIEIVNMALAQIPPQKIQNLRTKWLKPLEGEANTPRKGVVPYEFLISMAKNTSQHHVLQTHTINGVEHYVLVSPIDEKVEYFFASIIPVEVVQAETNDKLQWSILLTSACLILTLPISWLFSGPIVQPIRLLTKENEKIEKRQYSDVKLVNSNIREINELAFSLVNMSKAIEDYELKQKELMDAFIKLIAQAIDDKSPYTAGHCNRVPILGLDLAEAASNSDKPAFSEFRFENDDQLREFRIAAWLHDCGKITTPEHIVDKGSKLETIYNRIHEVRMRFEVLWRDAEINYFKVLVESPEKQAELYEQLLLEQAKLKANFEFIANANVGGEFMADEKVEKLKELANITWQRNFSDRLGLSPVEELNLIGEEEKLPATEQLLRDKPEHLIKRTQQPNFDPSFGIKIDVPENLYNLGEVYNLSIGRGTLTGEDRYKINEHIISTIKMLENLPFPPELSNVPRYASTHHETLKGTGYPRKLTKDDLSIPERVLVLADIFEALTAADRPYKKAKPLSVSIDILYKFVLDEHVDADIFELFLTSGIYLKYAEEFLQKEQIDEVDITRYIKT